jgi:1-acyl-sn-glycerol-3-phosphate acyltransferase
MRHPIRWMMSAEMMLPGLAWAWRRLRIIPVCFDSRDAAALKTAIAHVAGGGVLGIFPEGAIERPPRQLRPFSGGLRLILSRSRAPVLVATIDPGQPAETAYAALFKPTHARLRFVALIEPGPDGHGREASERIFELLKRETGWPVNDAPAGTVDQAAVERNLRAFASRDA